jgi:hypothetical protein
LVFFAVARFQKIRISAMIAIAMAIDRICKGVGEVSGVEGGNVTTMVGVWVKVVPVCSTIAVIAVIVLLSV